MPASKDLGQDVGVIHIAPTRETTQRARRRGARLRRPMGSPEDPVTGSLNASLAQWPDCRRPGPTRYLVAQGECLGRLAGCTSAGCPGGRSGWAATVTCIEGTAAVTSVPINTLNAPQRVRPTGPWPRHHHRHGPAQQQASPYVLPLSFSVSFPMHRPFQQVDVFTAYRLPRQPSGRGAGRHRLSAEEMQQFTRWTNLSEATFVLPPRPRARRWQPTTACIFYPLANCLCRPPHAGHLPRLAEAGGQSQWQAASCRNAAWAWSAIRQQGDLLAFAAPPLRRSGPLDEADVALIARGLGVAREDIVQHAWCDNGPGWRAVLLASSAQVLALKPDAAILARAGRGRGGACSEAEPPHRVAGGRGGQQRCGRHRV